MAMRLLVHQGDLQLPVPDVVIDEFDRVETTMTTMVAPRFNLMKQDWGDYGGRVYEQTLGVKSLAQVPSIGAMTTRRRIGAAVVRFGTRRSEVLGALSASSRRPTQAADQRKQLPVRPVTTHSSERVLPRPASALSVSNPLVICAITRNEWVTAEATSS